MKLHISLKEAALKSKVSPSLIYHYIQKGLLPSPSHVPNKGGGALAVYPKSIVQNILRIKKALKKKRSLDQVREGLSVEKKKIVEYWIQMDRLGFDLQLKANSEKLNSN